MVLKEEAIILGVILHCFGASRIVLVFYDLEFILPCYWSGKLSHNRLYLRGCSVDVTSVCISGSEFLGSA